MNTCNLLLPSTRKHQQWSVREGPQLRARLECVQRTDASSDVELECAQIQRRALEQRAR
jgi:hypothetical protein